MATNHELRVIKDLVYAGVQRCIATSGDYATFAERLGRFARTARYPQSCKAAFFSSMASTLGSVTLTLRDQGVSFSGWNREVYYSRPELAADLLASANDLSRLVELVNVYGSAVGETIGAGIKFTLLDSPKEESAPAPKPQQIEIVGMPTRETSSDVSYDARGNITSTVQTERDL